MWSLKKSINLSLFITYLFMLILVAMIFLMPWMVSWYVETMGRDENLPTFIMVAFYPCVPFCAITLWSLRNFLINVKKNEIFEQKNVRHTRVISNCCMIVALITFVGGFYYNPFYLVCLAAAFFFLNARIIANVLETEVQNRENSEK